MAFAVSRRSRALERLLGLPAGSSTTAGALVEVRRQLRRVESATEVRDQHIASMHEWMRVRGLEDDYAAFRASRVRAEAQDDRIGRKTLLTAIIDAWEAEVAAKRPPADSLDDVVDIEPDDEG